MPDEVQPLEREDIQGLVIRAYRMSYAAYLFYHFGSAARARSWLGDMVDPVTTAAEWQTTRRWCANVALTFPGLAALGLPTQFLDSFPDDFRQGMAERAALRLGDVGVDLPEHWEITPPFATRGVHAVLLVSARTKAELDERVAALDQPSAACELERVGFQAAAALGTDQSSNREHFGFRDGISQPTIKGSGLEDVQHAHRLAIAPGEFVLGHPDELGNRSMPLPESLGRNGTYAVYRKLRQHVAVFRDYLQNQRDGELLAAKLVGRWPSGAPVVLAKSADDPLLAADPARINQFGYAEDPLGIACPRGAHIRRAGPRDGSATSRRRLMLRRGLPYGSELPVGAVDDGGRGLVGLFLNASIERQFEFVQRKWLNWGQFDGLSNEADPITGPDGRDFTWQRRTGPRRYPDLPRLVTVRGGEYFFIPSITAMRFLSDPASF